MNTGLEGKTALVVGAGGGLGAAIARSLAAEGARVAAAGRTLESLRATAEAIEAGGGTAVPVQLDLARTDSLAAVLEEVRRSLGEVEILINNTGGPPPSTAAGVPADLWLEHFKTMVLGVLQLTDLVIPGMRTAGWGRIITSTSSGVVAPIPTLGISNALRATLLGWSKTLSRELAPHGITVNVVIPGRIATARVRQLDQARAEREGKRLEEVQNASVMAIPTGRYGQPEEYGAAVAFLASDLASYITGSTLRVDGGLIPSI